MAMTEQPVPLATRVDYDRQVFDAVRAAGLPLPRYVITAQEATAYGDGPLDALTSVRVSGPLARPAMLAALTAAFAGRAEVAEDRYGDGIRIVWPFTPAAG